MQTITEYETHLVSGGYLEVPAGLVGAAAGAAVAFHFGFYKAALGSMFACAMPRPYYGGVIISGIGLLQSIATYALIGGALSYGLASTANFVANTVTSK